MAGEDKEHALWWRFHIHVHTYRHRARMPSAFNPLHKPHVAGHHIANTTITVHAY
jgi:hypothetical protein